MSVIDLDSFRTRNTVKANPRRLDSQSEALPVPVAREIEDRFIGLYVAQSGWVGIDAQGFVFLVQVYEYPDKTYTCESLLADPVGSEGPRAA